LLSAAKVDGLYYLPVLRDSIILILTGKTKKRGRPRIRTAAYWREYYRLKQREWRAAHPRTKTKKAATR
jgi:hypothetical protein